jgi:hypothetical protein
MTGHSSNYTSGERFWLVAMAAVCVIGVNGAFLYGLIRPELMRAALTNPVSLAFIVEAFLLLAALAWLLRKWELTRLSVPWFVLLALLGGLAFALPVALLWRGGGGRATPVPGPGDGETSGG